MKLEIIVSTLQDGIYNLKFSDKFNYLVIHQIPTVSDNEKYKNYSLTFPCNVKYIQSNTKGLSISRNIGLKNSTADYIWIMDDDVVVFEDSLTKFRELLSSFPEFDMYVVEHSNTLSRSKSHNQCKIINYYSAMSISSIDMIIKKSSINTIHFDEKFGLGTNYPSGEEYIFAVDMLKNKKKLLKVFDVYSYHPDVSSGYDFFSTKNKLEAKLAMFSRCFGSFWGRILYILFIIKKMKFLIKNRKINNAIEVIFKRNISF
ncbi:glycosyltransferase family A protein [Providencia manganoxydans]|uniref:glycosyltransferase family A protein n=1 Tax=Providencia manganoxydans TaxID=2923283 RepID=UPI0032DB346B